MEYNDQLRAASGIEPVALEDPFIDPNEELLVILGDATWWPGYGA
jgi:hypothetical protein